MRENTPRNGEDHITSLLDIGLNRYEAQAYIALVSQEVASAKTISELTNIPYGKVYEIINGLNKKGFCIILPTKPLTCKALSPKKAIENRKHDITSKLNTVHKHITSVLEPMFQQHQEKIQDSSFWVITGKANVLRKARDLINTAQKEVFIYTTHQGLNGFHELKGLLELVKQKGITITIATPLSDIQPQDLESFSFCTLLDAPAAPNEFISVDSTHCLMINHLNQVQMGNAKTTGIWVQHPIFAQFFDECLQSKVDNS